MRVGDSAATVLALGAPALEAGSLVARATGRPLRLIRSWEDVFEHEDVRNLVALSDDLCPELLRRQPF